jgi:hypothetical protein
MQGATDDLETSPYKSKFTVLKLTQSPNKKSHKKISPMKPLKIFEDVEMQD